MLPKILGDLFRVKSVKKEPSSFWAVLLLSISVSYLFIISKFESFAVEQLLPNGPIIILLPD